MSNTILNRELCVQEFHQLVTVIILTVSSVITRAVNHSC